MEKDNILKSLKDKTYFASYHERKKPKIKLAGKILFYSPNKVDIYEISSKNDLFIYKKNNIIAKISFKRLEYAMQRVTKLSKAKSLDPDRRIGSKIFPGKAEVTSKTKIYRVWVDMKTRCYTKNSRSYRLYGARGITVCRRWKNSFVNFHYDMSAGYKPGLSIDRIDNDGNYNPGNCRWATKSQQGLNKRRKHYDAYQTPLPNEGMTQRQAAKFWHVSLIVARKIIKLHRYKTARYYKKEKHNL
jgi:hypothetical protein